METEQLNVLMHKEVILDELERDGYLVKGLSRNIEQIEELIRQRFSFVQYDVYKLNSESLKKEAPEMGMQEVLKWLNNGYDIRPYKEYRLSQLKVIYQGKLSGYNIEDYITPDFNIGQIKQILWGLEDGLDVSKYAKVEYTSMEMAHRRSRLLMGIKDEI